VRPFDRPHPIRGAFDDPRFHLGAEGALSAFHFGVDIVAKDGTAVYAVEAGYVHANRSDITVQARSGRLFGYWHVRPVVHTGQRVRRHQLIGHILTGWGHVHFAEAMKNEYLNPLRPRALTPFRDKTPPSVGTIGLVAGDGSSVSAGRVRGIVDVWGQIWDTPPVVPPSPWEVARLTPAIVWWRISRGGVPVTGWNLSVDFHYALMPASLYNWVYAPGSYQNKAHRPGNYLFWITHELDTTALGDGSYRLEVLAEDTRGNLGTGGLDFTVANGGGPVPPQLAPGMQMRFAKPS
jgi:murein DD-endopeptidase MepM/ murein hydrolase activator NlpD